MTAPTKSNQSKVSYIYSAADNAWYPMIGIASTTADYTWSGTHAFNSHPVTFEQVIKAKAGINNFETTTARDAALLSPAHGTVAFIKNVNSTVVNQIQYYSTETNSWVNYTDASFASVSSNYTLGLSDSGKMINVSAAATITIPANTSIPFAVGTRIDFIRTGSGDVIFAAASGVTINSKNSWTKLNSQYSGGTIVKLDTNTWILIGDLKS
jgi:hypothetical protein